MRKILLHLLDSVLNNLRSRATLQFEIIALRHQLEVLQRNRPARVRLSRLDRVFWILLYRLWPCCLDAVVIVKPETVIAWHRRGFRAFWSWKSRPRKIGRPLVPADVRGLIHRMCRENPLWGAPRIHGELLKLGIEISQAAVSKYMIRRPKPPSQTWRTFLRNHVGCLASVDFFVVPTATFRLLFVFIVLHHGRRSIVHFGVTAHPTSHWASQQIREAFPWETAPRYLIRDRDGSYGAVFVSRLQGMGINEVLAAPRSPWQNAYVERVIGSIRRECLDHIIVLNERHLRRILSSYVDYYHRSRTHLSLEKDCPEPRPVHPPDAGKVIAFPQVGGLHHRYERLAA
jgi:putative transposase